MIQVSSVSKKYDTTLVVDDVSLTIEKGGLTSIIGSNGAGKSTLLSLISRLNPMSAGSISVGGFDVTNTPSDELARHLSILRQDNPIHTRLRVRELVAFGRFPHTKGRPTVQDREHIDRAIGFLELESLADRFLDELSGGQRQRAFVAMVLCQDTDYVLLDEPLNSLDMKSAALMMTQLRRAADELGKTVVLVLHDINFAAFHSDRIIAMKQGKLLAQGTPEEVIRTEVLREVFDMEIEVLPVHGRPMAIYFTPLPG